MSTYRVSPHTDHNLSPSRLYVSVAGLALVAVMGVSMPAFTTVRVTVDGQRHTLPVGSTAVEVLERGYAAAEPGDLLDGRGGVLEEDAGEPIALTRAGRPLPTDARVIDGDVIKSVAGDDVVESLIVTETPIPITIEYEGNGPLIQLVNPGAVGVVQSVVGAVSGAEISSKTVEPMVPMRLRRQAPPIGDRVVALTFDDGPWPLYTQQVLEILEREKVKATFFMLGKQVRKDRAMAARIAGAGHLIGNHSLSHVYMYSASPGTARSEIDNCQAEIQKATGITPTWYRPAGGAVSPAVWNQTRVSKVKLITWSVDPQDYRCDSPVVLANRVISSTKPGSVVLLHDGGGNRSTTVKALTTIIRTLKSQGYTFVTLDELYPEAE